MVQEFTADVMQMLSQNVVIVVFCHLEYICFILQIKVGCSSYSVIFLSGSLLCVFILYTVSCQNSYDDRRTSLLCAIVLMCFFVC